MPCRGRASRPRLDASSCSGSSSLAQLASSLTATLSVLPVAASLLSSAASSSSGPALDGSGPSDLTSRLPLLQLSELEFSTTVQLIG